MSTHEGTAEDSLELIAVGDVSLGDSPQVVGAGIHARFERVAEADREYPFSHAKRMLEGGDVVFGNLETPLSYRGLARWNAASMEMRGHPDAAGRVARAGFTVLNVANNHMMQHGSDAFFDTVDALRRAHMGVAGLASTVDRRACVPLFVQVKGVRVAILGYAFEPDKYATGPVEYAFGPDCDIPKDVADARTKADVVICSMHWGLEFVPYPAPEEERLGREIIDAGAALVLGHHSHVARRVERYRNGLIAYSLGNFVFDQVWHSSLRTGLLLRATLTRAGVTAWRTELVWIGDDFQPRPLPLDEESRRRDEFDALSQAPAWVSAPDQYAREYERLAERNRYDSYRHFLRTLRDRPLPYTVQTLARTAQRKAAAALKRRPRA